ncbi:hypothetical protein Tco_0682464 [Tanacetum coccineum]|uniref:Uncharacterized protein n=1 Tax=Tanacetum coccineum TaxID=301880 RepID=A0ABQ4XR87_9ASTR
MDNIGNVLSSFEKGGLNIGSLKSFNPALLQKWRWRWFSILNALWVKVVKAIHRQEGGFDTYGCKFNGIWARIVGSSNFLHSKNIIPNLFIPVSGVKVQSVHPEVPEHPDSDSESIPSEEVSSVGYLIRGCFSIEPSAGMLLSGLADASGH